MSPQPSPPESTRDPPERVTDTDPSLDTDGTRYAHATPSIPALLPIAGLFVVYLAALTALGVRRAVSWALSAVRNRSRRRNPW